MAGSDLLNASHASPKVLYSGQLAGTSETTIYTAPAQGSAVLKHGVVCNTSGSPVTVNLSILQNGQATGSGTHRVISGYSLGAGDSLGLADYIGGCCLGPGDFVTVTAGTGATLDVVISGVENT